jgi:hypothetical protein
MQNTVQAVCQQSEADAQQEAAADEADAQRGG